MKPMYLILMVIIVTIYVLAKPTCEMFSGGRFSLLNPKVTEQEYIQDVNNIVAYVGSYIGGLYLHLRAQQFNPVSQVASEPFYIPMEKDQGVITENARHQVKLYLESVLGVLRDKYPKDMMEKSKWGISYGITSDNRVAVSYKTNGHVQKYLV